MSKRRNLYSGVQGESSARCSSGELALADLAGKYGVHPTQITSGKRQAKEGGWAAFFGKTSTIQEGVETKKNGETPRQDWSITVEKELLERAFAKRGVAGQGVGGLSEGIPGSVFVVSVASSGCSGGLGTITRKANHPGI